MRIASLILSTTPFIVGFGFLAALFTSQGIEGYAVIFIGLFSCAILMLLSLTSVLLAFLRTENKKLDLPARVMSIISTIIFVPLGAIGILMFINTYNGYSQWM